MLIMAACNWIGIDITQSPFLYCIEKEKKWKLHYGINLFLSNWACESLCMCDHFIDLFSPYLAFHLQIPSLEATVYYITLDKKQKIYNITPTLWNCSDHFSMAAVSPQFSRNVSKLRRETAELFPLLVYTGGPAFNLSEIGCYKFIDDHNCFIWPTTAIPLGISKIFITSSSEVSQARKCLNIILKETDLLTQETPGCPD